MSQLIIKRIQIKNFVHVEQADLELGPDIFFITGENRDEVSSGSNGSGKSTLLQMIGWCLFEENPRKAMLKDGVIGKFATYAQVVLTLEKDGREIIIDRVRNHPTRKHDVSIILDGEDSAMHSKSDSNSFIERLIGISAKVFYYCTYVDGDREPLVALTSARLNQVISEILDIQRFDIYLKNIREKKRATSAHLDKYRGDLVAKNGALSVCGRDIESYNEQIDEFDAAKKEQDDLASKELKTLTVERQSYLDEMTEKDTVDTEVRLMQQEVDKVAQLKDELARLRSAKDHHSSRVSAGARRVAASEVELKKAEDAYDNIFNNSTGACHYCGNHLQSSSDLAARSDNAVKKRDAAKADLIEAQVDLRALEIIEKEAVEKVVQKEQEISANQDTIIEFNKLKRKQDALLQIAKTVEHLDKAIDQKRSQINKIRSSDPIALIQNRDSKVGQFELIEQEVERLSQSIDATDITLKACMCLEEAVKSTKSGLFNSFLISLQENINANFDEISDGDLHCTLEQHGEELEILFTNTSKDGQYFPYWIFSRGEKAKIAKAASAALNEMMGVGLMIDDEGLDGVDDAGAGPLLDFIIKQNEGKSLFFVSHSSGVKDYFRGYKNIHVIKENGRATMEVRNVED